MAHPAARSSGKTVLVVEDAQAIRKLVCATLTQSGYHCVEAEDGAEALQIVTDGAKPDLVVTDMVMPRMGGSDLARHLARVHPEIPILFMSGYTEDPLVHEVERSSLFLAKPFTSALLMAKVREALDRAWGGVADGPPRV